MKILMTTDNIGGVWTFATDLAKGLEKSGVEVVLAVIGEPLTFRQKKDLEGISYRHFSAKQEWMDNPWNSVYATGQWLLWLKELENPDILHLNSYTLGCLDWNIPFTVTIHSCVLSWWEAVKEEKAPDRWNEYRNHVKAGINSADFVTAPSGYMMNAAEKHYGPFRSKKLIYNGRNPKCFTRGKKEKIVFSMGRLWDNAKNINLLIEAAQNIQYPVYIAGKVNHDEAIQLPANVTLLGQLSPQQVAGWLTRSWVYALPVKYEPFGYSFLEAAFSGCALVGGNIDSLNEIWGDAMVYSDTGNPRKLARTINKLMDNDWYLNHMSNKAYDHAHENYTLDQMVHEYIKLYDTMKSYKHKILHH